MRRVKPSLFPRVSCEISGSSFNISIILSIIGSSKAPTSVLWCFCLIYKRTSKRCKFYHYIRTADIILWFFCSQSLTSITNLPNAATPAFNIFSLIKYIIAPRLYSFETKSCFSSSVRLAIAAPKYTTINPPTS